MMDGIGTIIVDRSDTSDRTVDGLFRDFAELKLSEENGCTLEALEETRRNALSVNASDERVYKVFGSYYMERKMWREALRDLHCRLFLLDKESEEYSSAMEMIRTAQRNLLSEIMPIPVVFKEMLFVRNLEENWSKWISHMGYTDRIKNISHTENPVVYHSNTLVTKVQLQPGSLLMRLRPFSAAPWKMDSTEAGGGSTHKCTSCFHCLSALKSPSDPYYEKATLVSCPCKPYECSRVFCSEECFLNNGAVHAIECRYLVNLKSFAVTALNEALVLLVARTLIRCGLCSGKKNHKVVHMDEEETKDTTALHDDVLQRILKVKVDYSALETRYRKTLDEIQAFAHFLATECGVEFCLYLTHRELVHFIVVLWTKSLPLMPEAYREFDNCKLGGVGFNLSLLCFQQSPTPTLTLHFDSKGRIAVRSIYTMEPGTRLYINTAMDKYLPVWKQDAEFWSVALLLSRTTGEYPTANSSKHTICALRCNVCIQSFCYANAVDNQTETQTDESKTPDNYLWTCENCHLGNQEDLNLLQNKAESILMRVHRLYDAGQHLVAKRMLENFVQRWSGMLHWNHYLLYNAQVLLAGIHMNKPGSNIQQALNHLIAAVLMAEEMFPRVCHEKAHLYSRLADLMGQLVMNERATRKEDTRLKQMTLEAAYTALWNWTVIAGTGSREAVMHMQKCRSLAFQMNIHAPTLSNNFVINVPGKYIEVFKLVTGNCVIPPFLKFCAGGDLTDVPTDNVASIAFMAAQNGILSDSVLDVLMSIESYGIVHLGTGLGILGIAASNGNVELVKAMTESIASRVSKAFEFLSNNDDIADVEVTVTNLLLSLVGSNELGITPLMAMASVPADVDTNSLNNEIVISRLIIECAEKCDDIIKRYKDELLIQLPSLKWFMQSHFTLKGMILDARTHSFLKGQTILHYAASKGKRNLVQYLARVIGNVNQMNLEGATPLHMAALGGHSDVCETLLSFGADQYIPLVTGELPIHLAIHALHEPTVKLLLENYVKRSPVKETGTTNKAIGQTKKRGPSIWHALVAGIYNNKNDPSIPESGNIALNVIVSRLTKAVQIAQLLAENTGAREIYVWSDMTPSQILWQKWEDYMELNSHDFDPRENFQKLNLDNVNTLLQRGLLSPQMQQSGRIINDRTDAIFAATRAVQFLSQLLRRAEETVNTTIDTRD